MYLISFVFSDGAATWSERVQTIKPTHSSSLLPAGQFRGKTTDFCLKTRLFPVRFRKKPTFLSPIIAFRSLTWPVCRRCAASPYSWRVTWSTWLNTTTPRIRQSLTCMSSHPRTLSREAASCRSPSLSPSGESTRSCRSEESSWVSLISNKSHHQVNALRKSLAEHLDTLNTEVNILTSCPFSLFSVTWGSPACCGLLRCRSITPSEMSIDLSMRWEKLSQAADEEEDLLLVLMGEDRHEIKPNKC